MGQVCPGCGNVIPPWSNGVCHTCGRIEKEEKRYGRRRPRRSRGRKKKYRSKKSSSKKKRHTKRRNRSRSKRKKGAKRRESTDRPLPSPTYSPHLRRGINRFLRDLYGREMYVSTILSKGDRGLSDTEVRRLKNRHLQGYLVRLVRAWRDYWEDFLRRRHIFTLFRAYSLDGRRRSRDSDTQYILWKMRRVPRKPRLERITRSIAREVLQKSSA